LAQRSTVDTLPVLSRSFAQRVFERNCTFKADTADPPAQGIDMLTDEELAELRRTLEECARLMASNCMPSASEHQAAERMAAVSDDKTDLAA
jgi:hypothetical protein